MQEGRYRASARGSVSAICQLCRKPGHAADQCFSYHITKVRNAKSKGRLAEEEIRNKANEKRKAPRTNGGIRSQGAVMSAEKLMDT